MKQNDTTRNYSENNSCTCKDLPCPIFGQFWWCLVYIKKEDSYKLTEIARIICLKTDLLKDVPPMGLNLKKKAYF